MLFLWKHVGDMFSINSLFLSLHYDLVALEDELGGVESEFSLLDGDPKRGCAQARGDGAF
jgi:hypothetical protein